MDEPIKKKVDESWKEQADKEKREPAQQAPKAAGATAPGPTPGAVTGPEGTPQARFDLFVSGMAMEALIALGDTAHPTTQQQSTDLGQAKYMIDLLGILEEKTTGNLSVDEEKLLKDALYQLRMRYLAKGGAAS